MAVYLGSNEVNMLGGMTASANLYTPTAITPTASEQIITPDSSRDGFDKVIVSAVPTQSKTATQNGTVTPDTGKFLNSVVVNVSGGLAYAKELYSSDNQSITYTSTSAGTAVTISNLTGIATYPFVVVIIENTSTSAAALKFIRSATVISNINFAAGSVNANRYGNMMYYNSSSALTQTQSTSYGLWGYTIGTNNLTIRGRTSTSYFTSLTGTYKIRVLGIKF